MPRKYHCAIYLVKELQFILTKHFYAYFAGLSWVRGNAECLPLPDSSFDAYTIAFGIRNCTHVQEVARMKFLFIYVAVLMHDPNRLECFLLETCKHIIWVYMYILFFFKNN